MLCYLWGVDKKTFAINESKKTYMDFCFRLCPNED